MTAEEQELADAVEKSIGDALVTARKLVVVAVSSSVLGLHDLQRGEAGVSADGYLRWGFNESLMNMQTTLAAVADGTTTFTSGEPPPRRSDARRGTKPRVTPRRLAMNEDRRGELELFSNGSTVTYEGVARAFEPARLTQARVLTELTKAELADIVGVSAAAIGQYEAGVTAPRPDLFPELARALKAPVEFFATGRPLGRLDADDAHFRSLRSTRAKDRAKAATHAERSGSSRMRSEKHVRLPEPNLPRVSEGTSPIEAARFLRRERGVDRGPFAHLAATIEASGVIVSLIPMTNEAITRVSAYSTDALGRPLIIVTPERTKSAFRYRFTCAYELGHLLLHPNPLPGDRQQEREAEEFAAELLTRREQIEPLLPRTLRLAVLSNSATPGASRSSHSSGVWENCASCARRRQAQAGRSMSNQRHTRSRSNNRNTTEQVKRAAITA